MQVMVETDDKHYIVDARTEFIAVRKVLIKLWPKDAEIITNCSSVEELWSEGWEFTYCAIKDMTKC